MNHIAVECDVYWNEKISFENPYLANELSFELMIKMKQIDG